MLPYIYIAYMDPMGMVYGTQITIVTIVMGFINQHTYNWGGPHCRLVIKPLNPLDDDGISHKNLVKPW